MDVLDDLVGRVEEDIVVETSIDPALQAAAETRAGRRVDEERREGRRRPGRVVAMSPDGAVRALVGGRNYAESQFNRAVAAKRQPGSAFKPFVYLTALERGLTPDTVREDKPIAVKGWRPENYSREYFGPVHAEQGAGAVAQHRVGAADAGVRADRGDAHRAPARHRLQARAQRLDRARHLGGLGARAGRRLRAVRQWRHRRVAARGRARARPPAASFSTSASSDSLGRIVEPRYVGMMNAMMQETLLTRHRAQGRAAGLAGRRQDRHLAGFPRRLVRRLHRRISSPASGSATTTPRRPRRPPAADCRSRSGAGS